MIMTVSTQSCLPDGHHGGAGHPAAPCTPYFSSSMQSAYGPQGNFSKQKYVRVLGFCMIVRCFFLLNGNYNKLLQLYEFIE